MLISFIRKWYSQILDYFSGESKGYGLIKYVSSDAAAQARHLLDGRTVTSSRFPHLTYALDCDWLNSAHTSFKSLHSKALYVDHLPPNYRDMGEFRRIFSVFKSPPYCQVCQESRLSFALLFNSNYKSILVY